MKPFVVKTLLTFVLVALLAIGLDMLITHNLRRSDYRMYRQWNDLLLDPHSYDMLIMGSSRGWLQYDPRLLDSTLGTDSYNMGIDGRCIDAEVMRYNAYRLSHPKPKVIIQNVDYGTLMLSNGYEREQFLPYLQMDSIYEWTRRSEGFTWKDRYLPLVRYSGYLEVITEGLRLPNKWHHAPLYKGYYGSDDPWDGTGLAAADTSDWNYNPEALPIMCRHLDRCRAEGVQVVLVFAPIYIGVSERTRHADRCFALYDSLASAYGLSVLDYTYDSISYDTSYFYNASHMNRQGATLFSRRLAADLKNILQ